MAGTVLAALAAGAASNAMSELHADNQLNREKQLMNKQNALNRANALDAYSQQVQGLRMAGLSPAMMNGQAPTIAPAVTKGTVGMAENVEFDPANLLLDAQRENVQADTAKKEAETAKIEGVDTKNVEADTNLKVTQKLLGEANTGKVNEETTNMSNINKVFAEENEATKLFGQTMAQEWQKEPWYNELTKGQKMVLDDIAQGNFDLTIGFIQALDRSIKTNSSMNETMKNNAENALNRTIFKAQLSSPKVKEKLRDLPIAKYNELENAAAKMATEKKLLDFNYTWEEDKKNIWEHNDPDKLYNDYQKDPTIENAAKWLVASVRNTGTDMIKNVAPGAVQGTAVQKGLEFQGKGKLNQKKFNKAYQATGKYQSPFDSQKGTADFQYQLHTDGVQSMKK